MGSSEDTLYAHSRTSTMVWSLPCVVRTLEKSHAALSLVPQLLSPVSLWLPQNTLSRLVSLVPRPHRNRARLGCSPCPPPGAICGSLSLHQVHTGTLMIPYRFPALTADLLHPSEHLIGDKMSCPLVALRGSFHVFFT